jgi:hypothetical protein
MQHATHRAHITAPSRTATSTRTCQRYLLANRHDGGGRRGRVLSSHLSLRNTTEVEATGGGRNCSHTRTQEGEPNWHEHHLPTARETQARPKPDRPTAKRKANVASWEEVALKKKCPECFPRVQVLTQQYGPVYNDDRSSTWQQHHARAADHTRLPGWQPTFGPQRSTLGG